MRTSATWTENKMELRRIVWTANCGEALGVTILATIRIVLTTVEAR